MRIWLRIQRERFFMWVAEHMPRRLAYYATLRVGAAACVGTPAKYGAQIAGQITVVEALRRWDDQ